MIYQNEDSSYHINPCVELNLRMNMGATSRILYDKHIKEGSIGEYNVAFYKQYGEALEADNELKIKYPPTICDGKLISGYMALSPVNNETKYSAYIIIDKAENQSSLSSLYNR